MPYACIEPWHLEESRQDYYSKTALRYAVAGKYMHIKNMASSMLYAFSKPQKERPTPLVPLRGTFILNPYIAHQEQTAAEHAGK